jgi:DNA topoisomerase/Topoisomerase DNA binding C4 zinc finger
MTNHNQLLNDLLKEFCVCYDIDLSDKQAIKQAIKDKPVPASILEQIEDRVDIQVDKIFDLKQLVLTQKFTQPPNRYSAASLIKKLEDLGIGRPSTYASIISTLQDREYVEKGVASMKPSSLGRKVDRILKDNFILVTSSEMTANMEEKLDQISEDKLDSQKVISDFWSSFKKEIDEKQAKLLENKEQYRTTQTDVLCPTCSGNMELKSGRFGEYFQCLNTREHQFPKNFREYESALVAAHAEFDSLAKGRTCELCTKDLIVRVSKSTLKSYIACPDYKVGNKHTVLSIKSLQDGKDNNSKNDSKSDSKNSTKSKTNDKLATKTTNKTVNKKAKKAKKE